MTKTLFTGIAGRRTFSRELDDGRFVIYSISVGDQRQERFCTRAEWDEWCERARPARAQPGMAVTGATRSVLVVRRLDSGDLEVSVTDQRIMSQDKADRLVRRLFAEGYAQATPGADVSYDDDGS